MKKTRRSKSHREHRGVCAKFLAQGIHTVVLMSPFLLVLRATNVKCWPLDNELRTTYFTCTLTEDVLCSRYKDRRVPILRPGESKALVNKTQSKWRQPLGESKIVRDCWKITALLLCLRGEKRELKSHHLGEKAWPKKLSFLLTIPQQR